MQAREASTYKTVLYCAVLHLRAQSGREVEIDTVLTLTWRAEYEWMVDTMLALQLGRPVRLTALHDV